MYKLLVVDDEVSTRDALCNYFPWAEVGFEIIAQLENGEQALQYIQKNSLDVILCDIKMPIMSGIDLAKEIFIRKLPLRVVFLSCYRDFEYAQKALDFGVKKYIVKPAKYKDLMEVFSALKTELDLSAGTAKTNSNDTACLSDLNYNEKIIAAIKGYVEKNFTSATLESAAELVNMNANYLSQFFKNKTGKNFSDYLISVKMQKASELLMDIRYKTYEVSDMLGYSNSKNFTRTFKTFFGVSPREYKNRPIKDTEK